MLYICLMKSFLVLYLFLLSNLYGQDCQLNFSGKVLDNHDQSELAFTNIYILELEKGVVADLNGNFEFKNLCPGTYQFKVSHAECDAIVFEVTLDKSLKRNFYLEHHHLEEVEVSGTVKSEIAEETVLSGRELNLRKGQNLGNIVEEFNGVTTIKTGNSIAKPVIHGLHSSRILILNNHIIQESQQWGIEHAPEVDPYALGRISLIKGSEAVKYGPGAIGGVIILEPNELIDSAGIHGKVDLSLQSSGLGGSLNGQVEGQFKNTPGWSWRLQGSVKKLGNQNTSSYFLANTGVEEYNFSFNSQFKREKYRIEVFYSQFNTRLGIFKGAHIGNLTDLENAILAKKPLIQEGFKYEIGRPYQKIQHHLAKIGANVKTGNAGNVHLDFAYQRNNREEFDAPNTFGNQKDDFAEMQFYLDNFYGNVHWEHAFIKGFKGKIGINYVGSSNQYDGKYYLIPNYNKYGGGIYLIESWTKKRIKLEIGLRYDLRRFDYFFYDAGQLQKPNKEWGSLSANFGMQYRIDKKNVILINLYRSWRNPEPNELYSDGLHHGAVSIEYGNPNLKEEVSYGGSFNYMLKSDRIKMEFEAYANYMESFIYQRPGEPVLTIRGAFPTFNFEQSNALLTGADLSFSVFPLSSLELNLNGSTLWAYNLEQQEYISQMPADRIGAFIKYYFKESEKIEDPFIKLSGVGVSRQWKHSSSDEIYGVPNAYFLLNLESALTLPQKKGALQVGIEVRNILNSAYRDYLNRFRFFADEQGVNIILKVSYLI